MCLEPLIVDCFSEFGANVVLSNTNEHVGRELQRGLVRHDDKNGSHDQGQHDKDNGEQQL